MSSISKARTNVKNQLTKVLAIALIRSVLFTFGVIAFTYIVCTNPFIIAPLLMGEYLVAATQFACYVSAIFTIEVLSAYKTIKESIKLLWDTRNN